MAVFGTADKTGIKGLDKVIKNLTKEIEAIKGRTLKGLIRAAIIVRRDMEKSYPKIPVDTGNLRSSFFIVTSEGDVPEGNGATFRDAKKTKQSKLGGSAAKLGAGHSEAIAQYGTKAKSEGRKGPVLYMGFSAYYAWEVHEKMDAQFRREGAGPKFFQTALEKNKDAILKMIAKEAQVKK